MAPVHWTILATFVVAVVFRDLFKIGDVSIYHVVVVVLFLAFFGRNLYRRHASVEIKQNCLWLIVLLYLFVSKLFVPSEELWLLYMAWMTLGFMTFYVSRELALSANCSTYVRLNLLVLGATILIAFAEITVGYHLPSSKLALRGANCHLASGPFWNQNDFGLYIVLFLSLLIPILSSWYQRFALIGAVAVVLPATLSTSALIAFAVWAAGFGSLLARRVWILLPVLLLAAVVCFPTEAASEIFEFHKIKALLALSTDPRDGGYSAAERSRLIRIVWDSFATSSMYGLGGGGVMAALEEAGSDILMLHNFVLEMIFTFGIPLVLIIAAACAFLSRRLFLATFDSTLSPASQRLCASLFAAILCVPAAGAGPAFTVYVSPFWMWLGILAGIDIQLQERRTLQDHSRPGAEL